MEQKLFENFTIFYIKIFLTSIDKIMSINLDWEKIKEDMKRSINLTINKDTHSVRIDILDEKFIEDQMSGNLIQSEASLKHLMNGYIEKTINPKIEVNREENFIILELENEEDTQKIYDFFYKFFFGDILKNMIEALFGAFGSMYGTDG